MQETSWELSNFWGVYSYTIHSFFNYLGIIIIEMGNRIFLSILYIVCYSTCFISENWTSLGSALSVATLKVSPSTFEILKVRSSDPKEKEKIFKVRGNTRSHTGLFFLLGYKLNRDKKCKNSTFHASNSGEPVFGVNWSYIFWASFLPKASKFASLHAPQVIALLCFPTTGTFLDVLWLYSIKFPLYDPIAKLGPVLDQIKTFRGSRIPEKNYKS